MKNKKSNSANIEKSRITITLFSITISAILILIGLEWSRHDIEYTLPAIEIEELIERDIVVQNIIISRPKPKRIIKHKPDLVDRYEKKPIIEDTTTQFTVDTTVDNGTTEIIDTILFGEDTMPTIEPIINVAQEMPVYRGGLEKMYKDLGKNIRPNRTLESGTVYIEFVVEINGELSNVNIKKGVNDVIDENALDAVKSLGKWNAGRQGGRPVRVRMILPIKFTVR